MEYGFNKSAINRCEEEVLCGERCGDEGLNIIHNNQRRRYWKI